MDTNESVTDEDRNGTCFRDAEAWSALDDWFAQASGSARWMDLLGDYAGSEHFVIDGEALFQIVLDDPLLSIGRDDNGFQILHAYYSLERILEEYKRRGVISTLSSGTVRKTSHLSMNTLGSDFSVASRCLARSFLFHHLHKLPIGVHVFDSLDDTRWIKYAFETKPVFILSNANGCDSSIDLSPISFCQRSFLLNVLSCGISVALLKGAEYRDSKIYSFIYSPISLIEGGRLAKNIHPTVERARTSMKNLFALKSNGLNFFLTTQSESRVQPRTLAGLLRAIDILQLTKQNVPPEIIYIFLIHVLLLDSLTVHQRAQSFIKLPPALADIVRGFLCTLFFKMANVLPFHLATIEIDGTIFTTLVSLSLKHGNDFGLIIGHTLHQLAQGIWENLEGPPLNFHAFRLRFSLPEDPILLISQPEAKGKRKLLPFSNPVFEDEFLAFDYASVTATPSIPVGKAAIWLDDQHWHTSKPILPRHLGGTHQLERIKPSNEGSRLRANQIARFFLQDQAATLTGAAGASLERMVILPVGKSSTVQAETLSFEGKGKKVTLKSAEKLRLQNKENKMAISKKTADAKWSADLVTLSKQSLSGKIEFLSSLFRNTKLLSQPHIHAEMSLYRIQLELETWIADDDRTSSVTRDKYTVSLMRMVQDVLRKKTIITQSGKNALISVLIVLGFVDFADGLLSELKIVSHGASNFSFIKLISSRSKAPLPRFAFMTITEHPVVWQLRVFGDYMDRSIDSSTDSRVGFEPDAWQRRVLDGIDQNKSLLVVAPTSAGKTFISFYAMEKVFKESDDGILVYVAPTKALVTQIAAEVYGRFQKTRNNKSCWAAHTREFRINDPQECQILVTVPDVLAILLLSPAMAKTWSPRIKRIVLDEIHSIGQDEGTAWEQILLFAPCPIIGLSATIGSPKDFSDWLSSVQRAHGFEYDFIEHSHRYSHLRKFFYLSDGNASFESLHDHRPTHRMKFIHPITTLLFGTKQIPSDLSLEAADTLSLYHALYNARKYIPHDVHALDPHIFFRGVTTLLRQKDVQEYEAKLKSVILELLSTFDIRDVASPLYRVINMLEERSTLGGDMQRNDISPRAVQNDVVVLLADLHARNDLPAILFSFDRSNCEVLARRIMTELKKAEERWRARSAKWARKMKDWETWKKSLPGRQRAFEKTKGQRQGEDIRDCPEPSWHCSFDPSEPSPQFTFVGRRCANYSIAHFNTEIKSFQKVFPAWAIEALRRGVAVHHAGMHKHYRALVEKLFRMGFIRVIIATGTLALGINAPAKTSVFIGDSPFLTALMYRQCAGRAGRRGYDLRGNVIFYGLPIERVRRLILSKLPMLGGKFPMSATTTLRIFNLLSGSNNADIAVRAVKSMLSLPQIMMSSDIGQDQLIHHLRFSIEYLRRSSLLDSTGFPIEFAAVAAHLYYTEPSNLALVTLLRSRVLHKICTEGDPRNAKRIFMVVMCNLFGRRYLTRGFLDKHNFKKLSAKYPSMVILPRLPASVQKVLIDHDIEIKQTFEAYASAFSQRLEFVDNTLPLSRICIDGKSGTAKFAQIHQILSETSNPVAIRSPFVANSGHGDSFKDVSDLTQTARAGLNLNHHAIPSMSVFVEDPDQDSESLEHTLNAHLLDFYVHGQTSALEEANCIRRGDMWHVLHDFSLTLFVIRSAIVQFMTNTTESTQRVDVVLQNADPGDGDLLKAGQVILKRLPGTSLENWRFLEVVHEVSEEFYAKFKTICM